jgi:hypothetical protein
VGEAQKRPFQLSFNSAQRFEFQGARVTFDDGLILVCELHERLGLSALVQRQAGLFITWSLNREFKMEIPISLLESSA